MHAVTITYVAGDGGKTYISFRDSKKFLEHVQVECKLRGLRYFTKINHTPWGYVPTRVYVGGELYYKLNYIKEPTIRGKLNETEITRVVWLPIQ